MRWVEGDEEVRVVVHLVTAPRKRGARGRVECKCGWVAGKPPGVETLRMAVSHYRAVESEAKSKGWKIAAGARGRGLSVAERHPVSRRVATGS